ncbi:hypothetical protein CRYUN_Cryun32bG0045600 [Craigia yunnanensis]
MLCLPSSKQFWPLSASSPSSSWLRQTDTGRACSNPSPATLTTNGSLTSTHLSCQVVATEPLTPQVNYTILSNNEKLNQGLFCVLVVFYTQ